jgi:PHD/YefM family antitoxin component YafN of YafNO toxin-antitoxin module
LVAEDLASGRLAALWGFVETDARWVLCTPRGRENRNIAPLAEWLRKELARPL